MRDKGPTRKPHIEGDADVILRTIEECKIAHQFQNS